jgi:octaprenyl-diphosphate synthase
MKSASTIECACHIGALLGTENQELIDSFTLFGHNLGMASQIANDIHGIILGSDIVKQRVTLPVVYALAHTNGEAHDQLELAFSKPCESLPGTTQIRDLLFGSGAIYYTAIKMEFYKQLALYILRNLGKAGANIERLKSFLE